MTRASPGRATGAAPPRRVRIDALRTDARARVALSDEAVAEYADAMKAGARFLPIVVFADGQTLWVADGHHRVEAARRAGLKVVRAEEHKGGLRDALLYACEANAAHGVRRTNADKRLAVTLMLHDEEWCKWSNREIARHCAVDEGLVRKVRGKLSADDPQIAPAEHKVRRRLTVYNQRSARCAKLTPNQVAEIRVDARDGQQIADEHGIHKSMVSRIRNNKLYVDPNLPALPGFGALRSAWSAAGAAARQEFLRWIWSAHPGMISSVITEPQATVRHQAG